MRSRAPARVALCFHPMIDKRAQARVEYVFRHFCAVYGYEAILTDDRRSAVADVHLRYQREDAASGPLALVDRCLAVPAGAPTWVVLDSGHRAPLFLGGSAQTADLLGEVFLWLSGFFEERRPELGEGSGWANDDPLRRRFDGSKAQQHGLDPLVPWASLLLETLNLRLRGALDSQWSEGPTSPGRSPGTLVVTHDLDHFSDNSFRSVRRIAKNAVSAVALYRRPALAVDILVEAARRRRAGVSMSGDILGVVRREIEAGCAPSVNVLTRSRNRRDADYELTGDVLAMLHHLDDLGVELGIHGSSESMDTPESLRSEIKTLEAQIGQRPVGGRQHWLRVDTEVLFAGLEREGLSYDSSLGYPDVPGFSRGFAGAFLPYDLEGERPFGVVEIPLVLMDSALFLSGAASERADSVLSALSTHGWGACAALWHDTALAGTQLPRELSELYWSKVLPTACREFPRDRVADVLAEFRRVGLVD